MKEDNKTKVDITNFIVEQSDENDAIFRNGMSAALSQAQSGEEAGFFAAMLLQDIIDTSKMIVSLEFYLEHNPPNPVSNQKQIDKYKDIYTKARKHAQEILGDQYNRLMNEGLEEHNECARSNLDSSDGKVFSYVLPEFNEDGSHEPWGDRDVPWNQKNGV